MAAFALPRWGRPAAKATIKGGMAADQMAAETLARLRETLEDIAAEAAFERASEHAGCRTRSVVVSMVPAQTADGKTSQGGDVPPS